MGETVGGTILFGEADPEPLLGVTAPESVGIQVDPNKQRLRRLPAVRLKSLRIADAITRYPTAYAETQGTWNANVRVSSPRTARIRAVGNPT